MFPRTHMLCDLNDDAKGGGAGAQIADVAKSIADTAAALVTVKDSVAEIRKAQAAADERHAQHQREIEALTKANQAKAGLPGMPAPTGNPEKDFSLSRAILGCVNKWGGEFAKVPEREIVHEYHEHVLKTVDAQTRSQLGGVDSAGGFLVSSQTMMGKFITELLASPVALAAGVDQLTGLTGGDVIIPGELGGISVVRGAEASTIASSEEAYKDFTLRRKQFQGLASLSVSILEQTNGQAMAFVQSKLAKKVDLRLDRDFFLGSGSEHQPIGIVNTPGAQTVSWAGADFAGADQTATDLLESHIFKLKAENAYQGKVVWFCHPGVTQKLRTVKDSTGNPILYRPVDLMGKDAALAANFTIGSGFAGFLYGHPLYETTQLTGSGAGSHLILCNVQDCVWAMWDTVKIAISDQFYFDTGKVAVRVIGWQDSGAYRGKSIVSATSLTV